MGGGGYVPLESWEMKADLENIKKSSLWGSECSISQLDPWDWIIYLHEWLMSMVNVGKYTIHGSYGKLNFGGEGDDHIMWYDTLQETITWEK